MFDFGKFPWVGCNLIYIWVLIYRSCQVSSFNFWLSDPVCWERHSCIHASSNKQSQFIQYTLNIPPFNPVFQSSIWKGNMNNPIIRLNQPGLKGREWGITTPRRRPGETQSIHFSDIIFLKVPFLDETSIYIYNIALKKGHLRTYMANICG